MEKQDIGPELVGRLIAQQFPEWAHLPVRRVEHDGWDNTTFRLGEQLAVRLPSADRYVPQVEKEHRWLPVIAPQLPLPIPKPVARGEPALGFPRPWSVYRWLPGEVATVSRVRDLPRLAADLADFLSALHRIDATDGPRAGAHSFFRGGPLATYDAETRAAIASLDAAIDRRGATETWEAALAASPDERPLWVHGDISASNLLVGDGRLAAVIDFGCCAVGDPACDLAIAWTFLDAESRGVFRERLLVDDGTWNRGRGWALWKALITLAKDPADADRAARRMGWRAGPRTVVLAILADESR